MPSSADCRWVPATAMRSCPSRIARNERCASINGWKNVGPSPARWPSSYSALDSGEICLRQRDHIRRLDGLEARLVHDHPPQRPDLGRSKRRRHRRDGVGPHVQRDLVGVELAKERREVRGLAHRERDRRMEASIQQQDRVRAVRGNVPRAVADFRGVEVANRVGRPRSIAIEQAPHAGKVGDLRHRGERPAG